MPQFTVSIPADKISKVQEGLLQLHPNESEGTMTDWEWLKEIFRQWIINRVHRGLQLKAESEAIPDSDVAEII